MKNKDFKLIVYFFHRSGMEALEKLRFDDVTHINYAFAIPKVDGHVRPLESPDVARALIAKAHDHGVKVCLSLGGWSYEEIPLEATFREGTDSAEKVSNMVEDSMALVRDFGFDGLDVDWEYPRKGDGSKAQYEALMRELRSRLTPLGKTLTAAVFAGVDSKNQVLEDVSGAQDHPSFDLMDWMNIMTYDCDGPKHSTYAFAENCVKYWVEDRGFDPKKLNLGLPFYGRPNFGAYKKILELDPDALEKDMVSVDGTEVWYNGRETLEKKVALAKRYGMGGVMVWEIAEDCDDYEKSLLTVLNRAIDKD